MIKKDVDETINKDGKKPTLKNYKKSDLIYESNHSFYKYHGIGKFNNLSLKSNYPFLVIFFNDLDKFDRLIPKKAKWKKEENGCVWYIFSII